MSNIVETAARETWVSPEIRELSVEETHATPPLGTDGGPYPTSTS